MSTLDERVAVLEGRVQEQSAYMTDLRATGAEVRQELRGLRQELRQSIGEVRQEMGQLRDEMRQEMGQLRDEMRQEMGQLRAEMRQFRAETDRRFTWLVGMMVTGFLAVIGTVAGAFWGLLRTLN